MNIVVIFIGSAEKNPTGRAVMELYKSPYVGIDTAMNVCRVNTSFVYGKSSLAQGIIIFFAAVYRQSYFESIYACNGFETGCIDEVILGV